MASRERRKINKSYVRLFKVIQIQILCTYVCVYVSAECVNKTDINVVDWKS